MSCFRFGPKGHMVEIPAPSTGMGFDLNRDVTVSELVSGERSVYRTPLGFKSFDMNWAGGTTGLGEFMDIFEGAYGNGPYYMFDPRSANQNQLPARWASCWQLGHLANGWGQPQVGTQASGVVTPEDKEVTFTGRTNLPVGQDVSPFSVLIPLEDTKTYNISGWGTATGGAQVRATPYVGEAPLTTLVVPLNGTSVSITANYSSYQMFLKFELYVPAGATLRLRHMELMQAPEVLRTNLVPNPSFESNTVGLRPSGTTITQDTSESYVGMASAKLTRTSSNQGAYRTDTACSPGDIVTLSGYLKGTAGNLAYAQWNSAVTISGTATTQSTGPDVVLTGGWQRFEITGVVPAGAAFCGIGLKVRTAGTSPIWMDAFMSTSGDYFDGSFQPYNGKAYLWTGTANNSASQEIAYDGKQWHMGRGVGAVQFNGNMQGTLTSNKIDRIGLSVGVTEVAS